MTNTFLFELGTEEIPAAMIPEALKQLEKAFRDFLEEERLGYTRVQPLASSRRLAILIREVDESQPEREETVTGPPRRVALDEAGRPGPAALGFASRQGVGVDDLVEVETPRGVYLACRRRLPGRPAPQILAEAVPRAIRSLSWPRSMYWRESRFRFIRPIRWLVALWNDQVIDVEFEGLRAGRVTRGHRYLGSQSVQLAEASRYLAILEKEFVVAQAGKRLERIRAGIAAALPAGTRLVEDDDLLRTVVELNEYPSVLAGSFDPSFLVLPEPVLTTVLRHHQKYFSIRERGGPGLHPGFLTVTNSDGDPGGAIRRGHERVLRARLQDALFFWQKDLKTPLGERLPALAQVLFQEKLGSYLEKTQRIEKICSCVLSHLSLEGTDLLSAAHLAKVDLVTEMVRELPELQGIMGGLYARAQGLPETVSSAIEEQYRPRSGDDRIPGSREGALLSLADRMDTIAGCFSAGILPTGSSDPFALRRQALGVVRILLEGYELFPRDLSLSWLTRTALAGFDSVEEGVEGKILEFLRARLRYLLEEKGMRPDVVRAVLSREADHPQQACQRAHALGALLEEEDFSALAAASKRIRNILADQETTPARVEERHLVEKEEAELYRKYVELEPLVQTDLASGEYRAALRRLAGLRSVVDCFFDKVLVMATEEDLRRNRLNLLGGVSRLLLSVADISEIVLDSSREKEDS